MGIDCIVGYHLNPLTCGIAKFNYLLANKCNLPLISIFDPLLKESAHPLISIKLSEFSNSCIDRLECLVKTFDSTRLFSLFLHAYDETEIENKLIEKACYIYCGNQELSQRIQSLHKNKLVRQAWCPGGFLERMKFKKAEIEIFSFGMAHKLRSEYYKKLDVLLKRTGKTYCLYLSTALHEGTQFEGSFATAYEEIRSCFSGPVYFLGYLSDSALFNKLSESTFFAAFFDKGVRANNTSVHTAMQCGKIVITNLDQSSPKEFVHGKNVLDITQCDDLPVETDILEEISQNAITAATLYGWEPLCSMLEIVSSDLSLSNTAYKGSHPAPSLPLLA